LAWAGGIVALALGATAARRLGYMDGDSVTRLVVAANGLMLIWMGNRIPKAISPGACGQQAKRVAGWSMVLSGLVYTALWVFAPIQVAVFGGCGAIALGIAVTAGYCLSLRRRARMNAGRS
jgi:hypothetical protein